MLVLASCPGHCAVNCIVLQGRGKETEMNYRQMDDGRVSWDTFQELRNSPPGVDCFTSQTCSQNTSFQQAKEIGSLTNNSFITKNKM